MRNQNEIVQHLDQCAEWVLVFDKSNMKTALDQIKRARQKVGEGTYGFCDDCGIEIGYFILSEYPHATKCAKCGPFSTE